VLLTQNATLGDMAYSDDQLVRAMREAARDLEYMSFTRDEYEDYRTARAAEGTRLPPIDLISKRFGGIEKARRVAGLVATPVPEPEDFDPAYPWRREANVPARGVKVARQVFDTFALDAGGEEESHIEFLKRIDDALSGLDSWLGDGYPFAFGRPEAHLIAEALLDDVEELVREWRAALRRNTANGYMTFGRGDRRVADDAPVVIERQLY
jgi:hypothetical protein